jgi:hypothetical protein
VIVVMGVWTMALHALGWSFARIDGTASLPVNLWPTASVPLLGRGTFLVSALEGGSGCEAKESGGSQQSGGREHYEDLL